MKYLLIILLFVSSVVKAQNTKLYAVRFNVNGTTDSFWVNPVICNGVYSSAGTYIMPCIDSMNQIYGYNFPQSAGLFFKRADGIFSNLVFPGSTAIPQSQVTNLTTDLAGKLATNGNGSSLTGLTKTQVGLENVDNTSDANKPISSATQTALNLKANLASPTFTGIVSGITASMVGLGNVTNESKATMFTSPTFTGNAVLGTPASGNFGSGTFTWPTFNQNTTGSAATLTTTRTIWGQNFNGSANVTGDLALGVSSITMSGSIGVTGTRVTKIWSIDGEFTNMPTVGGTSLSSTFQALNAKLTAIAALANTSGFLKNDGAGNFSYDNPAGSGTVTNTGTLTSNAVILGNGGADTKVVAGITTNGTAQLVLGVNTTTLGSIKMFGNTSGDVTIEPSAVAGTAVTFTIPSVSGTPLLNTATSGVAATPTASGTTTVTHNLGRIPTIIRIYGLGGFTNNNSGVPQSQSTGLWTSSGNTCLFQRYDATAVTGAEPSETSTAFAVFVATSNGNFISGVIQNVTSTGFDIVWTETGTSVAQNYLWEAQ